MRYLLLGSKKPSLTFNRRSAANNRSNRSNRSSSSSSCYRCCRRLRRFLFRFLLILTRYSLAKGYQPYTDQPRAEIHGVISERETTSRESNMQSTDESSHLNFSSSGSLLMSFRQYDHPLQKGGRLVKRRLHSTRAYPSATGP